MVRLLSVQACKARCLQKNCSLDSLRTCLLSIYVYAAAKLKYGTILANVDWLHGSAESFLTITNLFIGKPLHCS